MMILYWTVAILVMLAYIYIPCVCLYGIVRLQIEGTPTNTLCNPFFGLKRVSQKAGFIVWGVQFLYLGAFLFEFASHYLHGTHPFFFDYFYL